MTNDSTTPNTAAAETSPDESVDGRNSRTGGGGRTVVLLQQIQSGQMSAKTVGIDDRRMLVAYLVSDGYSTAEIAQILKVSDRSVDRDKQAIRQFNALPKDPRLVEQLAGRLVNEAELTIQRIRRTSRDKLTPPAVKVDGEHRCFQILSELVLRLQGLGYLPSPTHRIEADLVHHNGDVPDLESLTSEMARLRQLAADSSGAVPSEINELEAEFQRAAIAVRVQNVAARTRMIAEQNGGNDADAE